MSTPPKPLSKSAMALLLQEQGLTLPEIAASILKPNTNTPYSIRQIQRMIAKELEDRTLPPPPKPPKKRPPRQKAPPVTKKVDIDVEVNDTFKEMVGYIQYAADHGIKASLNELTSLFDKTKHLENEEKDFATDNELLGKAEALFRDLIPLIRQPPDPKQPLYEDPEISTQREIRYKEAEEARIAASQAKRAQGIKEGEGLPDQAPSPLSPEITEEEIDRVLEESL